MRRSRPPPAARVPVTHEGEAGLGILSHLFLSRKKVLGPREHRLAGPYGICWTGRVASCSGRKGTLSCTAAVVIEQKNEFDFLGMRSEIGK